MKAQFLNVFLSLTRPSSIPARLRTVYLLLVTAAIVNTATRVLLSGIGLSGHDPTSNFKNQTNVRINPQGSDNCLTHKNSNRVTVFYIAGLKRIDLIDIVDSKVDAECITHKEP
mmetsp:Transcript_12740/g.23791  ORF Transcript_12740/g.23791 Transcript_12740/m.23791 type:complete len:114 (-) Transcript_12740:586-927(-)